MDVASAPGLPSTQGGCISAAAGLPSSTHGGCIANVALPSSTQVGYIAASPMLVKSSSFTGKCNAEPAAAAELIDQTDILTIDDLLDFSNEDIGGPIEAASCHELIQIEHPPSVFPALDRKLLHPCGGGDGNCLDSADSLCMPCDDLAELEWLSNFVEESFSSADAPPCLGWGTYGSLGNDDDDKATGHRRNSADSFRTTSPISVLESNNSFSRGKHCLPFSLSPEMSPVPGRARSKRRRTAVCFWNTRILSPQLSESLLETPSTTYAIQAASSESNMYNAYYDYDDDDDDDEEEDVQGRPQVCGNSSDFVRIHSNQRVKNLSLKGKDSSFKKPKSSMKLFNPKPKKIKLDDTSMVRKCLHCATQKTPQWRAGPMGPKTLCNACGVRYKSGRLCDEYRPAASPTFVETVHSNSHRKVLEMRRQRGEMSGGHHENHKHGKENNTHRLWWGDSGTCDSAGKTTDGNMYATALDEKEVDRSE